jgi:hypothetical protein
VVTDHSSLTLRQSAKLSARASRWWIALSEYRFQVVYRKGAKHVVPDALSRLGEGDDDAIPAFPFTEEKAEDAESNLGAETQPSDLPYMLPAEDDWKRALVTCPFAGPIVKILQGDLAAPWAARAFARRAVDKEKLLLRQGILVTEDGRRVDLRRTKHSWSSCTTLFSAPGDPQSCILARRLFLVAKSHCRR